MDESNELNLSNSGDENKTVLLDESLDTPNELSNENEDVNKQSTGSFRALDISEIVDSDEAKTLDPETQDKINLLEKLDDEILNLADNEQLQVVHIRDSDELSEDYIEETVVERLIGLTEMFPDSLRNAGYSILTGTFPLMKRTYNLSRTLSWIFFSSFAILVVPVTLEKERCQTQRDLDRQMLLGGGKGATGLGMAPAPISK